MKPAPFFVNFVGDDTYTFKLTRWPMESGLSLGAGIDDEISATETTDPRNKGNAMKFKKAFIKIGDQEASVDVDNSKQSADFELTLKKGKTELLAWFEMENGEETNAFYINVEKTK